VSVIAARDGEVEDDGVAGCWTGPITGCACTENPSMYRWVSLTSLVGTAAHAWSCDAAGVSGRALLPVSVHADVPMSTAAAQPANSNVGRRDMGSG
jgi:hypothetical protein